MTELPLEGGTELPLRTAGGSRRVVRVDSEAARLCGDLYSVSRDLQFVIDCLSMSISYLSGTSEGSRSTSLMQALWTAALVAYERCFNTGVRGHLTADDLRQLGDGALAVSTLYRDMRDRHVAHAVNPFEQIAVVAVVPGEGTSDRITIDIDHLKVVTDDEAGLDQFRRLAQRLLDRVNWRLQRALQSLGAESTTIGAEELRTYPEVRSHYVPRAEHVNISRRKI